MSCLLRCIIVGVVAGGLAGCFDGPVGADDDTGEINAGSVGMLAVASMGQTDSLSGTLLAAGTSSQLLSPPENLSVGNAVGLAKQALAKSLTGEQLTFDLSDTAQGIVYIMYTSNAGLYMSYDTAVVKWDIAAQDLTGNNLNIISYRSIKVYALGRTEYYSISDLDGDGIAGGPQGSQYNGSARFLLGNRSVAGVVEETVLDVSAGDDKDFDLEIDNTVLAMSWTKIAASGDTLGYAQFSDADNDGILVKEGQGCIVDVVLYERNNQWKPFVDYSRLTMRLVTDGTPGNDRIIRLSGEEGLVTGRVNTFTIVDAQGDATVEANEIATATYTTSSAPSADPVRSSQLTIVFDVGAGMQNQSDNRYHEIQFNQQKRLGWVRSRDFAFTTTEPVLDGQDPSSGHLEMSVEYSDGSTASLVADFNENGFSGTYTGPRGNVSAVTWDHLGQVVSAIGE